MYFLQVGQVTSAMTPTKQTRLLMAGLEALVPQRESDLPMLEQWERVVLLELYGASLPHSMRHQLLMDIVEDIDTVGWKRSLVGSFRLCFIRNVGYARAGGAYGAARMYLQFLHHVLPSGKPVLVCL